MKNYELENREEGVQSAASSVILVMERKPEKKQSIPLHPPEYSRFEYI